MRRVTFFAFVLLISMIMGITQEATTLTLSQAPIAVKITDPVKQLATFEPILTQLDDLASLANPNAGKLSEQLTRLFREFANAPGIASTGTYWIVLSPPSFAPPAPQEGGEQKKAAKQPWPATVLLPVADAGATQAFLASEAAKALPPVKIIGNYAVMTMTPSAPTYTAINDDLKTISTRDIVISVPVSSLQLPSVPEDAGPMALIFQPVTSLFDDVIKNQQRVEVGLTMEQDDLLLETITVPVAGSELAASIAAAAPSELPFELAGYLPQNLAYCSAGGPMMKGAPGLAHIVSRLFIGIGSVMLPTERQEALLSQYAKLVDQCDNGRALGITVPPANTPGDVSLVAIYQVDGVNTTSAVVYNFLQEVNLAKDAAFGGMFASAVTISHQPAQEKISNIPVDLVRITFTGSSAQPTQADAQANAPAGATAEKQPFVIECYIGYISDLMLVTAGTGSKTQMTDMIRQVQTGQAGFTANKRFLAMKSMMPATAQGFENLASLDIARATINLLPIQTNEKQEALKWLGIFPNQRHGITTYRETKDGYLRSEMSIPAEQLDFFGMAMRTILMSRKPAQQPAQ